MLKEQSEVSAADELSRGIADAKATIAAIPAGKTLVDSFTDVELEALDETATLALVSDTDDVSR